MKKILLWAAYLTGLLGGAVLLSTTCASNTSEGFILGGMWGFSYSVVFPAENLFGEDK